MLRDILLSRVDKSLYSPESRSISVLLHDIALLHIDIQMFLMTSWSSIHSKLGKDGFFSGINVQHSLTADLSA